MANGAVSVVHCRVWGLRRVQRNAPGPPSRASTAQGCHTAAPALRAAAISRVSSVSRPSARPHSMPVSGAAGRSKNTLRAPCSTDTRRSGAPAGVPTAARSMHSALSSGRLLAAMHSPHTLRRGKACFSTTATDQPARARSAAAVAPAGPPPTMIASQAVCMAQPGAAAAALRSALKQWLNSPAGRSVSTQPALGGHSALSSCPENRHARW